MTEEEANESGGRLGTAAVFYFVATLWFLWPLPRAATDHLAYFDGDLATVEADVHLIMWAMAWCAHALATAPWALFEANTFYPSTLSLAYSEHFLGFLPIFAPVWAVTGNAVLAANATVFMGFFGTALGTFLFARRLVGGAGALVAGGLFAFHPWRATLLGHFHILGVMYLAPALLCLDLLLERARTRHAVGVAVLLGLQLLTSFYLAYATVMAVVVAAAFSLARHRAVLERRRLMLLAAALGGAALPFLATSLPYLELRELGLIPSYGQEGQFAVSMLPGVLALEVVEVLWTEGIGVLGWALVFVGLVAGRAVWGVRALAVALMATGVLLALGNVIMIGELRITGPYEFLARWLPGFSAIRLPSRLLILAFLGAAILAGASVGRVTAGLAPTASLSVALLVLVSCLASRDFRSLPLHEIPVGEKVPPAYRWLAERETEGPLIEYPVGGPARAARRMYYSTLHWLPLVDGYSAYPPATTRYVHRLARGMPSIEALERLTSQIDIEWVLVHRDELEVEKLANWRRPLPPGLEKVAEFGDDLLLRISGPRNGAAAARLLRTDRTLGGVALVPFGANCPGEIRLVGRKPSPWVHDEWGAFHVEVINRGERSWPADGLVPRHLVRLLACFPGAKGRPCPITQKPYALSRDVAGGEGVSTLVMARTPFAAGPQTLRIEALQLPNTRMSDCGTPALELEVEVKHRPPNLPAGPFWTSCRDCGWDGVTLSCLCRAAGGGARLARTSEVCERGYANARGRLVCAR